MRKILTLLIFTFLLLGCEKENNNIMKDFEKQTLRTLQGKNLIEKGKISITVENKYYLGIENFPPTGVFTIQEANQFTTAERSLEFPHGILLGYNDYINNYVTARRFQIKSPQFLLGTPIQKFSNNEDKFYLFTDTKQINILHFWDIKGNDINITIQAFLNGSFERGDLLIFQFLESDDNTNDAILWTETIIKCKELPYISFLELLNNTNPKLKKLTIDTKNRTELANVILPTFSTFPIQITKQNIFGKTINDTIDGKTFQNEDTKQLDYLEIPLSMDLKNVTISFANLFQINKFQITLYLTLKN